ncbi:MAG TPA: hypothetical protein DEV93_10545 [Chloroflexi bacterium]|nr:hypothetical protein [Chloroflexota bacterium]
MTGRNLGSGHQIERRRFLAVAGFSGAGMAAVLAAGCGGKRVTSRSTPVPSVSKPTAGGTSSRTPVPSASKPKSGGRLSTYMPRPIRGFDPTLYVSIPDVYAVVGLYSGLLRQVPSLPSTQEADLATSWEVAGDGTVVLHMRDGVRWSDGQPLSASDVEFTFKRTLDPKLPSGRTGGLIRPAIEAVRAMDDRTVQFKIKPAYSEAYLLQVLATAFTVIVPQHIVISGNELDKQAVGTGPFRAKQLATDDMIWERNPGYYRPGEPLLDGAEFVTITDPQRQFTAIQTDQVQYTPVLSGIDVKQAAQLAASHKVLQGPNAIGASFLLNQQRKQWQDPRVWRAVSLTLDRDEIANRGSGGLSSVRGVLDQRVFGDYSLPESEWRAAAGWRSQGKAQDIAEAKKLIDAAGARGSGEILASVLPPSADVCQVIAQQLSQIGLDMHVNVIDYTTYIARSQAGDFDTSEGGNGAALPNPVEYLSISFKTEGGRNLTHFSNPALDAKIASLASAADVRSVAWDIQRDLLAGSVPAIPTTWGERIQVFAKNVEGYVFGPTIYDNDSLVQVWLS